MNKKRKNTIVANVVLIIILIAIVGVIVGQLVMVAEFSNTKISDMFSRIILIVLVIIYCGIGFFISNRISKIENKLKDLVFKRNPVPGSLGFKKEAPYYVIKGVEKILKISSNYLLITIILIVITIILIAILLFR